VCMCVRVRVCVCVSSFAVVVLGVARKNHYGKWVWDYYVCACITLHGLTDSGLIPKKD